MTGRPPSPSERPGDQIAPRAIPDGGLGEAMPEWLRRPPAWRQLGPKSPPRRSLPPPDTSVIDPATLITVDDLPAWLRAAAQPRALARSEPPAPPETAERRVIPRVIEARPQSAPPPPSAVTALAKVAPTPAPGQPPPPSPVLVNHERGRHSERGEQGPANAAIVLGTLLAVSLITIAVLLWLLLA